MKSQTARLKDAESKSGNGIAQNLAQSRIVRGDRVADQVYRQLRQAILLEAIAPGARLRENEIAAALQVSRTPVREAISRLIGDWLVREVNSGTGGVEVIDIMAEITEIYFIREALEICAARLAASRIAPEQLKKLDSLVKEAQYASFKERVRINQEFHLTIAEASGSPRLLAMVRSFREYFGSRRWISRQDSKLARHALSDHKKIVSALRANSPDTLERLLRKHLKLGWHELLASAKNG
jgi:DNA-binding GntR family transcriptional regulator